MLTSNRPLRRVGATAQERLAGAYLAAGGPSPAPFCLIKVSLCQRAATQHPDLVPHLHTPGNARSVRNVLQEQRGTQRREQLKGKCRKRGGLKERGEPEVRWQQDRGSSTAPCSFEPCFGKPSVILTDTPVPLRFGSTQRSQQEERFQGIPGNSYVVE